MTVRRAASLVFALVLAFVVVAIVAVGCRSPAPAPVDTPDARESPQATAIPAPLALQPPTTQSAMPILRQEGGASPMPLRSDEQLAPDVLPREPVGYTLSAAFRLADLIGPPRSPEVSASGLEAARRSTELRLWIDIAPTRMRMALVGHGFVLPADTEIRSRSDRYGHIVLWPGGATYRPLAPGALRALLGERRFDVAPITPAEVLPREETGRRISIFTRRVDVATRAARATFEIGKLDGAGDGGVLLCRLLLDLMNAPPSSHVCSADELPVRAELRWVSQGSLVFELTGVLRKPDMPTATLLVPPPSASFAASPLPVSGVQPLLTLQELAALRTAPVEASPNPFAKGDDLVVANGTIELRMLFVDGVPTAWVAPGARDVLKGLHRGRYVVQWRSFLGDAVEPAVTQLVPGVVQLGSADGGVR